MEKMVFQERVNHWDMAIHILKHRFYLNLLGSLRCFQRLHLFVLLIHNLKTQLQPKQQPIPRFKTEGYPASKFSEFM